MKIVLYSAPPFLDSILPLVRHLSKLVELHFLLDVSPESWNSSLFDVSPRKLNSGIIDADSVLSRCFPAGVRKYYNDCASFNLLIHNCPKSIHPASWWISRAAARFIRSIGPDIIQLDEPSLRVALSISSLIKSPICLYTHDPFPHSGEKNWRTTLARNLIYKHVRHFILHNAGQISKFSEYYSIPKKHVSSVPIGALDVFKEWERAQEQDDGKTILFFGRISPYKGLDVLFKAAPLIAEKIPGIRIIVAGRTIPGYTMPEPPDLKGNGAIKVISGYISNNQLATLFNESTVVVCPYIDATQSGVVLTSYAFNKPVVASDTGGLSEYVKHNQTGLLVRPGDASQLAEALTKLLSNTDLQITFKSGIHDLTAGELSWDNIARQTCDVYKQMLGLK